MDRMKTFGRYLIIFILFYVFVSFASYGFIRSTLSNMEISNNEMESPEVTIEEAKSSRVHGYVKGTVKNNTEETYGDNTYIKYDFISNKGNIITSKYLDVSNMKPGDTKDFNVRFNAENIAKTSMSLVNSNEIIDKHKIVIDNKPEFWLAFIIALTILF